VMGVTNAVTIDGEGIPLITLVGPGPVAATVGRAPDTADGARHPGPVRPASTKARPRRRWYTRRRHIRRWRAIRWHRGHHRDPLPSENRVIVAPSRRRWRVNGARKASLVPVILITHAPARTRCAVLEAVQRTGDHRPCRSDRRTTGPGRGRRVLPLFYEPPMSTLSVPPQLAERILTLNRRGPSARFGGAAGTATRRLPTKPRSMPCGAS
jgi:hypothetical protein